LGYVGLVLIMKQYDTYEQSYIANLNFINKQVVHKRNRENLVWLLLAHKRRYRWKQRRNV